MSLIHTCKTYQCKTWVSPGAGEYCFECNLKNKTRELEETIEEMKREITLTIHAKYNHDSGEWEFSIDD